MDRGWYFKEWLAHLDRIQAHVTRDLGWERGRVSKLANGHQQFTRDDVLILAKWLGIRPFELLMPPAEAEGLRRLRQTAALIVAEMPAPFDRDGAPPPKPGKS